MSDIPYRAVARADYLVAIAPFVGAGIGARTRAALAAVSIQPYAGGAGCVLIATNGSQLAVIYDESATTYGAGSNWRIPLADLKAALKKVSVTLLNRATVWVHLAWRPGTRGELSIVSADTSEEVLAGRGQELARLNGSSFKEELLVEEPYPEAWSTIAGATPGLEAAVSWYSPEGMCRVATFAAELHGLRNQIPVPIAVRATPQEQVVRVTFLGHPEALVVMTVPRIPDEVPSKNPSWLARIA